MNENEEALEKAAWIMKHLQGELSPEEERQLNAWLNEDEKNRDFFANLLNERAMNDYESFARELRSGAALEKINSRLGINSPDKTEKKPAKIRALRLWKAAAAILLFGSLSALGWWQIERQSREQSVYATQEEAITPGGNKATLTLSDGSVIALDGSAAQAPVESGGARIREKEGEVIYESLASAFEQGPEQALVWNTMRTPAGGQYQLVLPDGSRVWLNAGSELHFPSNFSKDIREVKLSGEAYFEIASEPERPFHVNVSGVNIEVLGTRFNVKAYEEEQAVETTLAEGKVKISGKAGAEYLLPGKQARVDKSSGRIALQTVDPEVVIAWTKGLFRFQEASIEDVMKKISRWYQAEVLYVGERPATTFTGMVARDASIHKVLELLEMTGGVHFQVEGKEIRVSR